MPISAVAKIWMDGQFVDWKDANVHVLTHGLHYGSGVFEGIRAYATDDGETGRGVGIFRLTDHMKRLHNSAKIVLMDEIPYSVDELVEVTKEAFRVNGVDGKRINDTHSFYIRPLVYRSYAEMGLNPLPCPLSVSIAIWPWGSYLGADGEAHGIKAKVSSWMRHDPNTMPPAAKGTAMYMNSSLAKVEAIRAGYDEAIMLNPQGLVAEASAANIFVVNGNTITTPPASAGALAGFRRDSVMVVARELAYEVVEANLARSDLYIAEEVFVTGTASELVPIRSIDDRIVGDPGPVTKRLRETMADVVRGKVDQYAHWCERVS